VAAQPDPLVVRLERVGAERGVELATTHGGGGLLGVHGGREHEHLRARVPLQHMHVAWWAEEREWRRWAGNKGARRRAASLRHPSNEGAPLGLRG